MAYCSDCGGQNAESLRFCIHCGKELKAQKVVTQVSKPENKSLSSVAQPALNATNKKNNTKPLIAALVLVVVVLAGIIFVMSRSNSSGEAEDKTNVATTIASDAE